MPISMTEGGDVEGDVVNGGAQDQELLGVPGERGGTGQAGSSLGCLALHRLTPNKRGDKTME